MNDQFVNVIAFQFGASMLVMCSNLYRLATDPLDANAVPQILYTACILAQLFIYCWFGNEVKLKVRNVHAAKVFNRVYVSRELYLFHMTNKIKTAVEKRTIK